MSNLVKRDIVKLGKYAPGGCAGVTYSNYYQWLTLSCGHKEKHMTDLKAWEVGEWTYCDTCGQIKEKIKDELIDKTKKEIYKAIKKMKNKTRSELGKQVIEEIKEKLDATTWWSV